MSRQVFFHSLEQITRPEREPIDLGRGLTNLVAALRLDGAGDDLRRKRGRALFEAGRRSALRFHRRAQESGHSF